MELLRNNPEFLLVAGMILISLFLFGRINKRRRQGHAAALTPHEQLERMRQVRGMRGDLEDLMVEIEQMAKRMGAHLDAKAMRLEHLLDQADQRIETLKALQEGKPASGPAQATSPVDAAVDELALAAQVAREAGELASQAAHAMGGTIRPADAMKASSQADAGLSNAGPSEQAESESLVDPLARKVYALADAGENAQQIASHLGEHIGKVELILALRHA